MPPLSFPWTQLSSILTDAAFALSPLSCASVILLPVTRVLVAPSSTPIPSPHVGPSTRQCSSVLSCASGPVTATVSAWGGPPASPHVVGSTTSAALPWNAIPRKTFSPPYTRSNDSAFVPTDHTTPPGLAFRS